MLTRYMDVVFQNIAMFYAMQTVPALTIQHVLTCYMTCLNGLLQA